MRHFPIFGRLARCARGVMAVETAIVAPVLAILALGAFEVTSIVARQHELQSAASEAESIAMTANAGVETQVSTIKEILMASVDLGEDDVSLSVKFRCGTAEALNTVDEGTDIEAACGTEIVSRYLEIVLTDSYEPIWTAWGIGAAHDYSVVRTVQVS